MNNVVDQDHRRVKQRIRPMLGFKRFDMPTIPISGIELAEKIKKGSVQDREAGEEIGHSVGPIYGFAVLRQLVMEEQEAHQAERRSSFRNYS